MNENYQTYSPHIRQKFFLPVYPSGNQITLQQKVTSSLNTFSPNKIITIQKPQERICYQSVTPQRILQNVENQTHRETDQNYNKQFSPADESMKLRQQLSIYQQSLQSLQKENEMLKRQQGEKKINRDSNLSEAVLRMEIDKLKFELQSKERNNSFLEERIKVEQEERTKINQLYSKKIEQEYQTNEHINRLKEMNNQLEIRLKGQKNEINSKHKEELRKQQQYIQDLQDQLKKQQQTQNQI